MLAQRLVLRVVAVKDLQGVEVGTTSAPAVTLTCGDKCHDDRGNMPLPQVPGSCAVPQTVASANLPTIHRTDARCLQRPGSTQPDHFISRLPCHC